jgi:aminopeptidase N
VAEKDNMRVFFRKEFKDTIDTDEIFRVTSHSLDYLGNYLDHPHPYKKLDQIFWPRHNFLGLSSQGILSYNEELISGEASSTRRVSCADTIAHEITHQWFGNLTTMKWWDDIWVIEGICVHMAGKILQQCEGYEQVSYYKPNSHKKWAQDEDLNEYTTHKLKNKIDNLT